MLAGRRALVIGLAREGVDLTRFLTAHGAEVVVSDQKSADQLTNAIGQLERMSRSSWVVMELSSFQLEPIDVIPHIALVTNVTPNHLDRHPTMDAYWAAKGQILAHQSPSDWAVLNADDARSLRYRPRG